jgi:hypothetical protein
MTREEAQRKMAESIYSAELERDDRRYIINKLELTTGEMDTILNSPPIPNFAYNHYSKYRRYLYSKIAPKHI